MSYFIKFNSEPLSQNFCNIQECILFAKKCKEYNNETLSIIDQHNNIIISFEPNTRLNKSFKMIWNLPTDDNGFMTKGQTYTITEVTKKGYFVFANNFGNRDVAHPKFFIPNIEFSMEWHRRAFELLDSGLSFKDIALKLNAEKFKNKFGKPITPNMVYDVKRLYGRYLLLD